MSSGMTSPDILSLITDSHTTLSAARDYCFEFLLENFTHVQTQLAAFKPFMLQQTFFLKLVLVRNSKQEASTCWLHKHWPFLVLLYILR